VTELTHDAEDGFHEIQLSGKQLVFLFMATTVVSVVIFLCGVLVGRGVRAERGEDPGVVAASQVAPPTTSPGASEAPTPPAETPLSYPDRLRQESAAAETLKKAEPAVKPPAPQQEAVPHEPPPPAAKPAAEAAPAITPATGESATGPRPGNWVIQVHALQNQDAANTLVRNLKSKGYPAFLLAPSPNSPQIFRVQIGGYRDRSEAEKVASRLKEEQFKPDIKRR
jgi:cell division septation protein DedD